MKINRILISLLCFEVLLIWSCCKENAVDLRDQYIGKYQVHEQIYSYGPPESCGEWFHRERDTAIVVGYGNTDSTLSVLEREVWLDSAGWYTAYHYGLHMRNDSIWSHFMNGGLGCGQYEIHEGVRISPDIN